MAHRGKKIRQDKIDGGMRSCADAGTGCDRTIMAFYVVLGQHVLEQLLAPC